MKGRFMALLEALPETVATSLRELQEQNETDAPRLAHNGAGDPEPQNDIDAEHAAVSALIPHKVPSNGSEADDSESPQDEPVPLRPLERPIVFATDITADGAFGEEWLVVDDHRVYVFAGNGGGKAKVIHNLPLRSIREANAEVKVGNGHIEVRTDDETISLVRFSQATVGEANTVTRQITALSKGEQPKAEKLDAKRKHCPKCKRVLPEDTEVCPACVNKRAVMLRLFRFLAPYEAQATLSVFIILASTAVGLLPPYIGGRMVDELKRQLDHNQHDLRPIISFVGILAGAALMNAVFTYGARRIQSFLGARVSMDIRVTLYDKFNQLSLGYYDKRSTGTVMSRITNDSEQIWDFLAEGLPWLVTNSLSLVTIGIVLLRLNWRLALLMLLPGPFIYMLNAWFMPRARKRWHHVWHRISKMYASLNSSLNGMRVVKAFAQEDRESGRFGSRNQQVFEASFAANSMWATYWPILSLLIGCGSYIIWIYGGNEVLRRVMTLGELTMFSGYLMQFYLPFQNFSRVMDWTTRSLTAAERVFEILDTDADIQEAKDAVPMPDMQGGVEFEEVSFTYDNAKRVLENFTLKVEPGEMIGLVGHSGAGKSTIINLLSRFYDVTEGTIKIDGVDIREIRQGDFRGQFGIVLQEPFLFPGTIRDNIAYAKPDASIEEIMRAAKAANCHNFILKFPDGYDTQVGERGQRLSGGERQRISIARAILHDPKILILDEATASVDTETEKQIQEAIARLIQNRTTFAIAHRLSTLRNASRLVVMKDGKMAECGTHDELMEIDGVYANLVKIQNEVNKIKAI